MVSKSLPDGLRHLTGYYTRPQQEAMVADVRELVRQSPLFQPVMPRSGRPLSVRMTNLGPLGWVADKAGYRYQQHHPVTGDPWPPIPHSLLALWRDVAGYEAAPEACLVNWYSADARMGLHRDEDEDDRAAPVVSVSLGATAVFRIGGETRKSSTRSLRLRSGDVVVLGGRARQCYHGVDRLIVGEAGPVADGGRLNLTLRRVTLPV